MADAEHTGFMYAAHRDVLVIEALAKDVDPYTEAIAFHSQQAAEKMVKNVFVQNGTVPGKTHSVDELLSSAIEAGWLQVEPKVIDAAISISMHAVAARYSQAPDINRGEALQAIADCNTIASSLAENGYDSISIKADAHYLRGEECEDALDEETF